jgi:serine/threonine protein kinase
MSTALTASLFSPVPMKDLKPANILLVRGADGQLIFKLADFGMARVMGIDNTAMTELGTVRMGSHGDKENN